MVAVHRPKDWFREPKKWLAIFKIWFQDSIVYKASTTIWVLTDVVTAIAMPLVWIAGAKVTGGVVGGYPISQMVAYYMVSFAVAAPIVSHILWDVAVEIREGLFLATLLRPISLYQYIFFRSLSFRLMRPFFFFPFLIAIIWMFRSVLAGAHVYITFPFFVSIVLGHLVSFTMVMALSPIALYTQEAYSLFELYYAPMILLSGQLFPISALPNWAQNISHFMPFYYTTGVPSELGVGRITGSEVWIKLSIQALWALIFYGVGKLAWKKGLKIYTGIGL